MSTAQRFEDTQAAAEQFVDAVIANAEQAFAPHRQATGLAKYLGDERLTAPIRRAITTLDDNELGRIVRRALHGPNGD